MNIFFHECFLQLGGVCHTSWIIFLMNCFHYPRLYVLFKPYFEAHLITFFGGCFFFCFSLSFMKSCIVFEGLSIVLISFCDIFLIPTATFVLILLNSVSHCEWYSIWMFVYQSKPSYYAHLFSFSGGCFLLFYVVYENIYCFWRFVYYFVFVLISSNVSFEPSRCWSCFNNVSY